MKVHKELSQTMPEGYYLYIYHGYPSYHQAEYVLIGLAEIGDVSLSEMHDAKIVKHDRKYYICLKGE